MTEDFLDVEDSFCIERLFASLISRTDDLLCPGRVLANRVTSIGGGADEVMLGIISKFMGTLPKAAK